MAVASVECDVDVRGTDSVERNYHHYDEDFDLAPVDDIGRKFACISCKHVRKNDAIEPVYSSVYVCMGRNFCIITMTT